MLGLRSPRALAGYQTDGTGHTFGLWDSLRNLPGFASPQTLSASMPYANDWAVMGIPAAWRCATLIAQSIASLPMLAYTQSDSGEQARVEPTPTVLANPWPMLTYLDWHFSVIWSLILRGNAYALPADIDQATGYPRQFVLLNPDEVWVDLDDRGMPVYAIGDEELGPADVMHIRGITPPGSVVGIGVIEAHRRGLSTMLALEQYALDSFATSGVPSGIITVDRPELGQTQADDLKARWMAAFSGRREPAVVPRSISFKPLAFSPEDMAYVEAKKLGATEVCWIFGVHPMMIGAPAGTSMTYGNVEAVGSAFARDSLMGWSGRVEQTFTKWIPRALVARYSYDGFLRGTTLERMQAHDIALRIGVETLNEARDSEHRPRFDDARADEPLPLQETKAPPPSPIGEAQRLQLVKDNVPSALMKDNVPNG